MNRIKYEQCKLKLHGRILDHIPYGSSNAITMRELADLLNSDQRTIRRLIEKARTDGNLIAGTDAGIFIPETEEELREYVQRNLNRIKSSVRALQPAYDLLSALDRQGEDGEEDEEDEE